MLDSTSKRILFHTGNKGKFLEASGLMMSRGIRLELLNDLNLEFVLLSLR